MRPAMAVGGGGCGLLVVAVIAMLLGADGGMVARIVGQALQQQGAPEAGAVPGPDDEAREFISVVLRDTEQIWTQLFRQQVRGTEYVEPKLVIFSGRVDTGCGIASSEVGPFYCPNDQRVYIDPVFFQQLRRRHQAPGDFAQAYVIAHEVAHHVQHLLGFTGPVNQIRQRGDELAANQASVRLELQADYLAGVWANHAHREYNILEDGDIVEAINAANRIGDDTLMRESTGYVIPSRFTHGTSEQRVRWFKQGFVSGDLVGCQQLFDLDYSQL
jgi:predicted metalloprotease